MSSHLERGQRVRVNAYGGKKPYVTVVEDRGEVVLICKPSEFERAKAENRDPMMVGFHREDIIERDDDETAPKKHPERQHVSEERGTKAGD
jgi:hypothetical protein